MSEASPAPDLEDVRGYVVDVKERVDDDRDRAELCLAISALDLAIVPAVGGPLRAFALRDCQHHCREVAQRLDEPDAAGELLGTARMLEEVLEV